VCDARVESGDDGRLAAIHAVGSPDRSRLEKYSPWTQPLVGGRNVYDVRKTMGATDSKKAEAGTIRNLYGTDIERNAIHGSDSPENAAKEIAFFFSEAELI